MTVFFKVLTFLWSPMLLFTASSVCAQAWMPGYEYRCKITINKSKVAAVANADLLEFPVLIELENEAFVFREAACGAIQNDPQGRNICFALAVTPTVKLNFQIESYDPIKGKYRCWVKIPLLSAATTSSPATALYFYQGGSVLHDNYSVQGLSTWNSGYTTIWHLNGENSDGGGPNVKTNLAVDQLHGLGLTNENTVDGKIGKAVKLNEASGYLQSATAPASAFSFSVWIKWEGGGGTQMIAANDSLGIGWQLSLSNLGRIKLRMSRTGSIFYTDSSNYSVVPGVWTQVGFQYLSTGATHSGYNFYVNGTSVGSGGSSGLKLGPGGRIVVGRRKDGTQHFNGVIDELRIYADARPLPWLKTEYNNQGDPASFYSLGLLEFGPSWASFEGTVGSSWTVAANWLNNVMPVPGGRVRIAAGKTARITGADVVFGQLLLEEGARLSSGVNIRFNCMARIEEEASVSIDSGKKLTLVGDVVRLLGGGKIEVWNLELAMPTALSTAFLEMEVSVFNQLKLVKGILQVDGKLKLRSTSLTNSASLAPINNLAEANIRGLVQVQCYVDGGFPSPASGRGWRLLSSPVVHTETGEQLFYGFQDVKQSIFVTGEGGTSNRFDASPNNGATIFLHNQALPGALNEKYTPISNMSVNVPVGRGFYVFSRGSRLLENAYKNQIQTPPYPNPSSYILTYTGRLLIGEFLVQVFNADRGDQGDGYNLLGNPYASSIRWGSLVKENLSPFVWLYDPLNQSYRVSDDPDTIIPVGTGFFVKVLAGKSLGKLMFWEGCKVSNH